jgi:hypothetical protein
MKLVLPSDSPAAMVRAVLVTSLWFGALITIALGLYGGLRWGIGFAAGGAVGSVSFVMLKILATRILRVGPRPAGRILAAIAFKLLLVYGGLAALILWRAWPTLAIVAGFSLPLVVIILKAAGRAVLAGRPGDFDGTLGR